MCKLLRNLVALSIASLVVAPGCGPSCPSQPTGCDVPTQLSIPLPVGTPEAYDIALSFRMGDDVETDRCLAILPPPEDWGGNLPVTCLRGASLYIERDMEVDCSASFPEGASCSVNSLGFTLVIRHYSRVDGVKLQFTRGDTTFAPLTVEPTYGTYHPDGPDCPGTCEMVSAVVSFEALVEPMPL